MTPETLTKAIGCPFERATKWVAALDVACARYHISDNPMRLSAFLAQVAHESNLLAAVEENLNYSAKSLRAVFPKYFQTEESAINFAKSPERIANKVYGGRMGNGLEASGEGYRFRGRGLIQLTGKDNYRACGEALGVDLLISPEALSMPPLAAMSAAWFWDSRKLNPLADEGDFDAITQRINGGQNGRDHRLKLWTMAKEALGAPRLA